MDDLSNKVDLALERVQNFFNNTEKPARPSMQPQGDSGDVCSLEIDQEKFVQAPKRKSETISGELRIKLDTEDPFRIQRVGTMKNKNPEVFHNKNQKYDDSSFTDSGNEATTGVTAHRIGEVVQDQLAYQRDNNSIEIIKTKEPNKLADFCCGCFRKKKQ